jgi:hypothetical protein
MKQTKNRSRNKTIQNKSGKQTKQDQETTLTPSTNNKTEQ